MHVDLCSSGNHKIYQFSLDKKDEKGKNGINDAPMDIDDVIS